MSLFSGLRSWLGRAAAKTLKREDAFVIAVTGSVGKSSAKQAIGAMLQADIPERRVRVPEGSYNNEFGLPLTVFGHSAPGRNPWAWFSLLADAWLMSVGWKKTRIGTFVLEMGADKPGDIQYLTKIAPPDIAVVTAVTTSDQTLVPVHAANYRSLDEIVEQKAALVKALKPGGLAILNADDKKVFAMRHDTHEHVLTYGEADGTDVRITYTKILTERGEYGNAPTGLEVGLENYRRSYRAFLPHVYGTSVAYAYAAATAVSEALDVPFEQVNDFAAHFSPAKGRARIIPGIKHTTLFDDTYNASPASVLQSLRDLASVLVEPNQRKIVCLGEMRELGDRAEEMHRRIGSEVAKLGIDILISCGIFGRAMADGALANGMKPEQVHVIEDTPEAGLFIQEMIQPGDIILAKGSEGGKPSSPNWGKVAGVRMERVIKELMAEPQRAQELLVRQSETWKRK